jgi:hypothetical protein
MCFEFKMQYHGNYELKLANSYGAEFLRHVSMTRLLAGALNVNESIQKSRRSAHRRMKLFLGLTSLVFSTMPGTTRVASDYWSSYF